MTSALRPSFSASNMRLTDSSPFHALRSEPSSLSRPTNPLAQEVAKGLVAVVHTCCTAEKLVSFRELRLLVGAGAPDAAGAGASVVVIDEPAVRGRSGQGAVAVGHGQQRVDRVRRR